MYTYVKWHPLFLLMSYKLSMKEVQDNGKIAIFANAKLR